MAALTQVWAYPARVTRHEAGDWVATFDDVPEALTGGATRSEALALARDALEETLLAYLARGRDIPVPRPAGEGEDLVVLGVVTAARAALARTMKSLGISNSALGREIHKSEGAIRRLVDGTTGVKIDTVLEALDGTASFVDAEVHRPTLAFVG
ncbi:MAG: type II toxin-antitoxin system HicB family antitoxin [Caulobacteraceae bacterium]